MGTRGPIPKRSDQRHGHRSKAHDASIRRIPVDATNAPSGPDLGLTEPHPLASDWYESLRRSGQAVFFQPSDWQTARVWAEFLSRVLHQGDRPSAVLIAAWSAGATELLTTEGARRRVQVELQTHSTSDPDAERASSTVRQLQARLAATPNT